MTPTTDRAAIVAGRRRVAAIAAVAIALSGFGLTGCSIVNKVNKVVHDVSANRQTIKLFTQKLQAGEGTTFAVTYVTTGANPSTVSYAVQPPTDVAFKSTQAGSTGSNVDLIVNSSGAYSCTPPSGSSGWTCQQLGQASAVVKNHILDFYTPAHWITFLQVFALAAGFAGDKVSSSTMTVNGFNMDCVDFVAAGVKGTSTICTTAQNILGYVKVASSPNVFEIKSYTASPPASAFQLPPGAKVTSAQGGNG